MKHILITIIFLAVLIFTYWFIRQTKESSYAAGYNYIKSVRELQEQVGAEPDGIVGPETIKKLDRAYCDQEAVKMFRRMAK